MQDDFYNHMVGDDLSKTQFQSRKEKIWHTWLHKNFQFLCDERQHKVKKQRTDWNSHSEYESASTSTHL